ncbi:DUF1080 domain-containing protein [Oscillatoria amoena NRMC-F 0135]|nr:DUF1080 domain-containing protein [Oscillatoria amoena NRMC-F 0135]
MRILLTCIGCLVLLPSCEIRKQPKNPVEPSNFLTEVEKTEGWDLLFDGSSLKGWRIFKNLPNNSWEVQDGTLHCKSFLDGAENLRSDLITSKEYENFELTFQWKISYQGNSGVLFRVSEDYEQAYASGPEYQVIDDIGYPGDLPDENKAAANFAMHAPTEASPSPTGDWNDARLVVQGDHIEHWLNGSKVVEYDLSSEDWNRRRNASKWKDFPGYASFRKGYIALQDHGNEVWFRNIKIRVL